MTEKQAERIIALLEQILARTMSVEGKIDMRLVDIYNRLGGMLSGDRR